MSVEKPVPVPDQVTEPYWSAASDRQRVAIPRCDDCGASHFYPRPLCPFCGSAALSWTDTAGRGTVYSFTVVHRAPSAAFEADVPYVVAIVALEEGPHLMSRIVDCPPESVRVGMAVAVRFEPRGEVSLPVFGPSV